MRKTILISKENKFYLSKMYKIIGFITLIAIILFAIILHLKNNNNKNESNNNPINEIYQRCALHNGRNPNATGRFLSYFDDLLTSPKQPEYEKGIFFVQSRCLIDGIPYLRPRYIQRDESNFHLLHFCDKKKGAKKKKKNVSSYFFSSLHSRSACSIEAAAKNNPQRDIFLIYTSPVGWPLNQNEWPTTIRALDEYQNIHFRNVQIKQLTVNSPVEEWLNETSRIWESNSMTEHLSDLMRTLLLYHYGGTYADLDYMILKDLSIAEINWIGSESEDNIESSIINFSFNGIGHEMAHESLR